MQERLLDGSTNSSQPTVSDNEDKWTSSLKLAKTFAEKTCPSRQEGFDTS